MIAVQVCVDHKAYRPGIQRSNRPFDLFRERSKLVIDQQVSFRPGKQAHISTGTSQHVDVIRQLKRPDLDRIKILLRGENERKKNKERYQWTDHGLKFQRIQDAKFSTGLYTWIKVKRL